MSTPGCFSFLKKAAPEPPAYRTEKPYTANKAMPAEPKSEPTQPRLPEAHEHYEPCFCAEVGSGFGKMALDAELPAYSASSPFSSDVSRSAHLLLIPILSSSSSSCSSPRPLRIASLIISHHIQSLIPGPGRHQNRNQRRGPGPNQALPLDFGPPRTRLQRSRRSQAPNGLS